MNLPTFFIAYAALLIIASVITFMVYAWDKRQARQHKWRVSERTLHVLELLGGWPGAWLAMRWLRHKSVKRSFRVVFGFIVALHGLGVAAVVWWGGVNR